MANKRLFVGTFLSADQQNLLGTLRDNNERLSQLWQRKLRWVKSSKLHMTWFFLGDVSEDALPELFSCLADAVDKRLRAAVSYDRLDFWPSPRKPRQLVLTAQAVTDDVVSLGNHIRKSLGRFAAKSDAHSFRPHITLLRFEMPGKSAGREPLVLPDWFETDKLLPVVQSLKSVDLIESHMGAGSGDYEVVRSFPLA